MKLIIKILSIGFSWLMLQGGIASGVVPIMPLQEVKPGMKAVCKTVFQGTAVEDFELEIVDIIKNYTPQNDVLLVRLLSSKTQETGVVAGMSGSPVYIDGKLVGALAYRFGIFTKESIGGVTPIEQMLDIFSKEEVREQERSMANIQPEFPLELALNVYTQPDQLEAAFVNTISSHFNTLPAGQGLTPIRIPLSTGGLNIYMNEKFTNLFNQLGFQLVPGGVSGGTSAESPAFEPGSAVAGVIIDGDLNIAGTGTITYVDTDKILAFGHPFFGSGAVNLPLAPAKILTTISSSYASYKMAEALPINGTIHQDRISGILGIIGKEPQMIPVHLTYQSPFHENYHFHFRLAEDKSLSSIMPLFLWLTLYNSLYSARMGDGDFNTQLKGRISIEEYEDVVLDNFYAGTQSGEDVILSTLEIAVATAALMANKFLIPNIKEIELNFQSTLGNKSAEIERIWYDKSQVKPGESINFNIFVRPYLQDIVKLNYNLKIPKNLDQGIYTVLIGGADYVSKFERSFAPAKFDPDNFEHLVKLLNEKRKNNRLSIQLRKPEKGTVIKDQEFTRLPPSILAIMNSKRTSSKTQGLNDVLLFEHQQTVDWALSGGQWIRIRVIKDKN